MLWHHVVVSMCLHSYCVLVLLCTECCDCVSGAVQLLWFPALLGLCNAVMAHLIVSSIATNDMCHHTKSSLAHTNTHTHYRCIVANIAVNTWHTLKGRCKKTTTLSAQIQGVTSRFINWYWTVREKVGPCHVLISRLSRRSHSSRGRCLTWSQCCSRRI